LRDRDEDETMRGEERRGDERRAYLVHIPGTGCRCVRCSMVDEDAAKGTKMARSGDMVE